MLNWKTIRTFTAVLLFAVISFSPIAALCWKLIASGGLWNVSVFADARRMLLLWRTIYIAGGTALCCGFIGLITATALLCLRKRQKTIMSFLLFIPLFIPPFVQGIAWPNFLFKAGIRVMGEAWLTGLLTLCYFPIVMALTIIGINSVSKSLWEAARLRHGRIKTIATIIIPLAGKNIAIGIVIVFLLVLGEYGLASVMQVQTYPVEIMTEFSAFYDVPAAIRLCIPLVIPIIASLLILKLLLGKGYRQIIPKRNDSPHDWNVSRCGHAVAWCWLLVITAISVILPIIAICSKLDGLDSFAKAWNSAHKQIAYSFLFCLATAILSVGIGWAMAHIQLHCRGWKQWTVDFLTYLPFVVPGTLMGIGYIMLWNRSGMEWLASSIITIPIIYIGCLTPLMQKSLFISFSTVHQSLNDASAIAPRSWLAKVIYIELPLVNRGLLVGLLAVFVLAFRELNATVLTLPPGIETLALRTYTLSHYGADDMVMALCLICIVLSIALYITVVIVWKSCFSSLRR